MLGRAAALAACLLAVAPCAAAEWGAYGADGWPVNVDGESTNPLQPPLNVVGPVTLFPYWPLLTAEVQRVAADHPDTVRLHSAGTSTLGLDLWMLEIADFARIDAGEGLPLEEREVVWVDGGTHSNEYSGVYFALHVAQFLAEESATNDTARWIVQNRHTWILPMVNPDGSHAMGRLNAHLVNINRNYPVVWDGEGHDATLNNRGPSPASEVETRINIEWFNRTQPDYYASVHCCGNLWLYPYGEEGVDPRDNEMFARTCREAFASVLDRCGPIWSTIYPASGSSVDTAYEYTGAVAFGYEMSGRGAVSLWGQPLTTESVRVQEVESWEGVLHAFLNVHRYGAHPRVAAVQADGEGTLVTVANEGYGPLLAGHVELVRGDSVVATAALPQLAASPADGASPLDGPSSAQVLVPGRLQAGEQGLVLHHQKRIQGEPWGERHVRVAVGDDGTVTFHDGPYGADAASLGAASLTARSPGAGPAALVAALGVAALLARRR